MCYIFDCRGSANALFGANYLIARALHMRWPHARRSVAGWTRAAGLVSAGIKEDWKSGISSARHRPGSAPRAPGIKIKYGESYDGSWTPKKVKSLPFTAGRGSQGSGLQKVLGPPAPRRRAAVVDQTLLADLPQPDLRGRESEEANEIFLRGEWHRISHPDV